MSMDWALHSINESFRKIAEILTKSGITDNEIKSALPVIIASLVSGMDEEHRDLFIANLMTAVRKVDEIAREKKNESSTS